MFTEQKPFIEWCVGGWVSLLDMMRYGIRDLHALLVWVNHTISWTYGEEKKTQEISEDMRSQVYEQVRCLAKHCQLIELPDTMEACSSLLGQMNHIGVSELRGALIPIREVITKRLDERIFLYVPNELAQFAPPLKEKAPLRGDLLAPSRKSKYTMGAVLAAFPIANYDIEQVAMCMTIGASTAVVFHAMRIVEFGIRALGRDLGVQTIEQTNPKSGRTKRTRVEYATWDLIRTTFNQRIERKMAKFRPAQLNRKSSNVTVRPCKILGISRMHGETM